ncbi:MAG: PAS domain S-box protein [Calditrichaeota bacterium]|nr:MAG: PAS domain S-box protein [Calditrichota bacterium]
MAKQKQSMGGFQQITALLDDESYFYLILDKQGRIVHANEPTAKTLGYSLQELSRLHLWDVFATCSPDNFARMLESLHTGEPKHLKGMRLRRKKGAKTVELRFHRLQISGEMRVLAIVKDPAERQRIKSALRESEERFRKIFDHSNDAIFVIDPAEDRIVDANPRACTFLGYTREELLRQPVSAIHPNEMPQLLEFAQTVFQRGHGWTNELSCITKSGSALPSEMSASVIEINGKNYMIALVRDISARKRAEQALRESEQRLSSILKSAMDAIITIDEEMNVVLMNEAAEKMFGCKADQMVGQSFGDFLPAGFCHLLSTHIQTSKAQSDAEKAVWAPEGITAFRANGEEFPIECTISRVDLQNQRLFTVILRDINERKKAEEALTKLELERTYLQEELKQEYNFGEIIGASHAIREVFRNIERVAGMDTTVLITGETGTGKELVARAIHEASPRKQNALIKVNCAALPAGLIESELFGHEKGAFTGATHRKQGRFEMAHGGTLFLDEIGELPLDTQTKLLRVLQEQEFERVGGSQTLKVDVRVLAATNRDLEQEVQRGAFRADLFFRLNIFPIVVPPLRERKEDIPLLADYFLRKYAGRAGKHIVDISPRALELLQNYHWPGNVRELANIIERATILCDRNRIQPEHLMITPGSEPGEKPFSTLEDMERQHILAALEKTRGVIGGPNGAAKLLGLNRTTLISRMQKLGISR